MDDELNSTSRTDTDFEKSSRPVGADQHRQVVEFQYAYRVLKRVEHVRIVNAVLSGAAEDDRIHIVKLT